MTELTDSYVVQLVKNQLETEIVIKKKNLYFSLSVFIFAALRGNTFKFS